MGMLKKFANSKEALNQIKKDGLLLEMNENLRTELQKLLLEMCLDVLVVCKKKKIPVALIGGSALGAVRHKGFIPWDDDLDLGMTREAYKRFLEVFESELGDKYMLSAPNYKIAAKARFPKVLKKGTVLEEVLDSRNEDLCKVFLDIFILDNVPENRIYRKIKGYYCNFLELISGMVFFYENASEESKRFYSQVGAENYKARMMIGKIFSFRNAASWFNSVDKAVQYKKETNLVGIATGRKHYFGEILDKNELFPLAEWEFEGHKVSLFKNQDYYLKNLYGEYMRIPPVEKRERHFIKRIHLGEK